MQESPEVAVRVNRVQLKHPVYGIGDDYITLEPALKCTHRGSTHDGTPVIEVCVQAMMASTAIGTLLANGNAMLCADVVCSRSFYRRLFTSSEAEMVFAIPSMDVTGIVTIEVSVIARGTVRLQYDRELHPDYAMTDIAVNNGELLAFVGKCEFDADDYSHSLSRRSLLCVLKSSDEHSRIDLSGDRIEMYLNSESYESLREINRAASLQLPSVLVSAIGLPAIQHAIVNLHEYFSSNWATVIKNRLRLIDSEIADIDNAYLSEHSYRLAALLLKDPVLDVSIEIKHLLAKFNELNGDLE